MLITFLQTSTINIQALCRAQHQNSNKLILSIHHCLAEAHKKESRRSGSMKLRLIIEKLQKVLWLLATKGPHDDHDNEFDEDIEVPKIIPEDVKEGHFAVLAVKGEEPNRFVVKLESLNNPAFLKLLEQAKEEYGFEQKGALAVPCRPEDLHKILENRREKSRTAATINNNNSNTINLIEGY